MGVESYRKRHLNWDLMDGLEFAKVIRCYLLWNANTANRENCMGKGVEAGESVVLLILYSIEVKGENMRLAGAKSVFLFYVKIFRFLP